jgi:hypothetical protein
VLVQVNVHFLVIIIIIIITTTTTTTIIIIILFFQSISCYWALYNYYYIPVNTNLFQAGRVCALRRHVSAQQDSTKYEIMGHILSKTFRFSSLRSLLCVTSYVSQLKLEYISAVWNCITSSNANKIEGIQQKFVSASLYLFSPQ